MICRIADFNIEFKSPSKYVEIFLSPFKTNALPEISFEVSAEEIAVKRKLIPEIRYDQICELSIMHSKLSAWVAQYDTIFLHAALIDVKGTGVAFTALSGTGKTTHMLLWKKLLSDKLTIVNGDKPFIRFFDGEKYPYGYGTPWNGKEHFGTTGKVQLKHLCFIERGEKNTCERLKPSDVLEEILKQAYIPRNTPQSAYNSITIIDRILNTCVLWKITCNTDIEAAEVAYNTIFKEQNNEA